jgi:hypothetical protein
VRRDHSIDRVRAAKEPSQVAHRDHSIVRSAPERVEDRAPRSFDRRGPRPERARRSHAANVRPSGPRPERVEEVARSIVRSTWPATGTGAPGRTPRTFDRQGPRPPRVEGSRAPRSFDRQGPRSDTHRAFDRPRARPVRDERARAPGFVRPSRRPPRRGEKAAKRGPDRSSVAAPARALGLPSSAPRATRSVGSASAAGAARPGRGGQDRPPRAARSGPRSGQKPRRFERGDSTASGRRPSRPRGRS